MSSFRTRCSGDSHSVVSEWSERVVAQLEALELLDPAAAFVQGAVRRAAAPGTAVKDLLSGTWLGHPFHPALTDVVVGSWTSAWLVDVLGGERGAPAAEALVGTG